MQNHYRPESLQRPSPPIGCDRAALLDAGPVTGTLLHSMRTGHVWLVSTSTVFSIMELETLSIFLVLLAALCHAVWNAFVKSGESKLLMLSLVMCTGAGISVLVLPFVDVPHRASWVYIFLSIILHTGYYAFLVMAYRAGDLSHVYPIMRGFSPVTVALLSWFVAGEALGVGVFAGVCLVSLGIVSLTFGKGVPTARESRAVVFALLTGLCITGYTVVDGLGVRASGSPLGYIAWLFAIEHLPLTLFAVITRRKEVRPFLSRQWKQGIGGGILATAAYAVVIWAMSLNEMALVSALRETSVIFGAAIGCYFLRESFGKLRLFAAVVVAAGVVLMNVFR